MNYEMHLSGAEKIHKQGHTGKGITVAVIDTGCIHNHVAFKPGQVEITTKVYGIGLDDDGHGTWCCSKVAEIAPDAKIVSIKISDPSGIDCLKITEALKYCLTRDDIDLISVSLSIFSFPLVAQQLDFENTINKLWQAGKPVICAAGNEGTDKVLWPACLHNVITVGSVDKEMNASYFSSISNEVDVCQIGVNAIGADWKNINGYTEMTGTSMATPLVAGMCALIMSKDLSIFGTKLKSEELFKELIRNTLDTAGVGRDNKTGVGIATFNPSYMILDMYLDKDIVVLKTPRSHSLVKTDVAPQIINGRAVVPARFISEKMGALVNYFEKDENGNLIKNIEVRQ